MGEGRKRSGTLGSPSRALPKKPRPRTSSEVALPPGWRRPSKIARTIATIAAIGAVLGGVVGYWNAYRTVSTTVLTPTGPTATSPSVNAARLSIVVLPFTNLSGNPSEEYVADAITDQVTSQVSKIRGSFVIARNTAFTYKGKPSDAKAIGNELGVLYVLQGSVSQSEARIVVNTQLVDTRTAGVIWSNTLEVKKDQLDSVRREIATRLAFALKEELFDVEARRAIATHPKDLDAQDLVMQAVAKRYRAKTFEDYDEIYKLYGKALALDPHDVSALVGHAFIIVPQWTSWRSSITNLDQRMGEAEKEYTEAIALEPNNADAHFGLAQVRNLQVRYGEAMAENNVALELDPNYAAALALKGLLYTLTGKAELAVEPNLLALALSPREPRRFVWMRNIGQADLYLGNYQGAIEWYEKARALAPTDLETNVFLTAAYAQLGDMHNASEAKTRVLEINPAFEIPLRSPRVTNAIAQEQREKHFVQGLLKAGLPLEKPRTSSPKQ